MHSNRNRNIHMNMKTGLAAEDMRIRFCNERSRKYYTNLMPINFLRKKPHLVSPISPLMVNTLSL